MHHQHIYWKTSLTKVRTMHSPRPVPPCLKLSKRFQNDILAISVLVFFDELLTLLEILVYFYSDSSTANNRPYSSDNICN